MALDNAQFISELSPIDPPGTDPLNQGDDHIRTTKLAVQQSFPNVGSAVPQTGAQMAQMAIKNEVNAFTQANSFVGAQQFDSPMFLDAVNSTSDNVLFMRSDVPAGRWDIAFEAEATSGDFYIRRRNVAGASLDKPLVIAAATGFATFANITFFNQATLHLDGSAGAPAISFQNQQSTGFYRPGTSIGFTIAGVDAAFLLPAQFRMIQDGQAAAPAYSFQGSTNMGFFRQFATSLGLSVGGAQRFAFLAGQMREFSGGTAAIPAYSFNSGSGNMGMYRKAADEIGFSILNTHAFTMKPTTINIVLMPSGPGGGLVSGDLYVKQSQAFAPTELVIGMQP